MGNITFYDFLHDVEKQSYKIDDVLLEFDFNKKNKSFKMSVGSTSVGVTQYRKNCWFFIGNGEIKPKQIECAMSTIDLISKIIKCAGNELKGLI
jgi:hypothetical protein